MKRVLLALVPLLLGAAQALSLSGSVEGAPRGARVGAWTVDSSGRPLSEVASVPVSDGQFSLNVPGGAPSGRALWPLTGDSLAWPGLTGNVSIPAGLRGGELRLFVYADGNGNGRHDDGEEMQEGTLRAGKASVVIAFADRSATVSAGRGFSVTLNGGWNVLTIELGKNLRASVRDSASGLQLGVR